MFLTELYQTFSSRRTHRLSAGVLVAGNRVQKSGVRPGERFFQFFHVETCLVHRNADDVQPLVFENLKGQEIARLFDKDRVAGIGQM